MKTRHRYSPELDHLGSVVHKSRIPDPNALRKQINSGAYSIDPVVEDALRRLVSNDIEADEEAILAAIASKPPTDEAMDAFVKAANVGAAELAAQQQQPAASAKL